jgi:hypothetical protein
MARLTNSIDEGRAGSCRPDWSPRASRLGGVVQNGKMRPVLNHTPPQTGPNRPAAGPAAASRVPLLMPFAGPEIRPAGRPPYNSRRNNENRTNRSSTLIREIAMRSWSREKWVSSSSMYGVPGVICSPAGASSALATRGTISTVV